MKRNTHRQSIKMLKNRCTSVSVEICCLSLGSHLVMLYLGFEEKIVSESSLYREYLGLVRCVTDGRGIVSRQPIVIFRRKARSANVRQCTSEERAGQFWSFHLDICRETIHNDGIGQRKEFYFPCNIENFWMHWNHWVSVNIECWHRLKLLPIIR